MLSSSNKLSWGAVVYQSIKDQIGKYLAFFEGAINWMYLDERGLVTTGKGNLLDPYASFGRSVRFVHKDGSAASDAEVKAEFDMVKSKTVPGGGRPDKDHLNAYSFRDITNLRATDADIYAAVTRALAAKEGEARGYFGPDYDTFPADVQVVLMQMGYAGGLASRRNQLAPLLKKRDFWMARQYTYLTNKDRGRDGYKKYNAAFPMLMTTGWIVDQCKDKKMLHWAPKDPSIFYGYERFLQVKRWYMGDTSPDIRLNDEILMGNGEKWLNDKAK